MDDGEGLEDVLKNTCNSINYWAFRTHFPRAGSVVSDGPASMPGLVKIGGLSPWGLLGRSPGMWAATPSTGPGWVLQKPQTGPDWGLPLSSGLG